MAEDPPKRVPRWRMSARERDAGPRAGTNREITGPVQRLPSVFDDLDEHTPPPCDLDQITSQQAWEHATHVAQRTADALTHIAHTSGVGMSFGDEMRTLHAGVSSVKKKMKWWQALAIAALTASGATLVGVAQALYTSGEKNATVEMRLQSCERQAERNREDLERLQDTLTSILRERSSRRYIQPEHHQ